MPVRIGNCRDVLAGWISLAGSSINDYLASVPGGEKGAGAKPLPELDQLEVNIKCRRQASPKSFQHNNGCLLEQLAICWPKVERYSPYNLRQVKTKPAVVGLGRTFNANLNHK